MKAVRDNEADVRRAGLEFIATGPCKTYRAKSFVCLWPCTVGPIDYDNHAANHVLVH